MMTLIYNLETGEADALVHDTAGHDLDGKGVATAPENHRDFDWDPGSCEFIPAVERIRAETIGQINTFREAYQAEFLTPGHAKAAVYAAKRAEVLAFDAGKSLPLPFAQAHAKATASTVEDAVEAFREGAATSDAELARLEAIAQMGIAAVKAARTVDAIYEAQADINWNRKL